MLPQEHRSAPPAAWLPPLRRRLGRSGRWSFGTNRLSGRSGRWRWSDRLALLTPVMLAIILAAACSSGAATGIGGQTTRGAAASGDPLNLRGACPTTIVVQSSWFPEADHGAEYQLLGKGYSIDPKHKSVTGPLVASGADTGVKIQIRAGGPAIGFQQTSAQMYADPSITLGMLNTDELIQQSKDKPVLGVVAPLDLDPQVIMWDPKTHPDWNTISDIGQTDSKVLYYQGSPYMDYLLGAGVLRPSQVDASYDGTPSRFTPPARVGRHRWVRLSPRARVGRYRWADGGTSVDH